MVPPAVSYRAVCGRSECYITVGDARGPSFWKNFVATGECTSWVFSGFLLPLTAYELSAPHIIYATYSAVHGRVSAGKIPLGGAPLVEQDPCQHSAGATR